MLRFIIYYLGKIFDNEINATHTTPDPLQINAHLSDMVAAGVEYCFMEVSSHGIDQERIQGLVLLEAYLPI